MIALTQNPGFDPRQRGRQTRSATQDWHVGAVHEAGHACGLLAYGGGFRSISLQLQYGQVTGETLQPHCPRGRRWAIAALMGPVAEARYSGVPLFALIDSGVAWRDAKLACDALERAGQDSDVDVAATVAMAEWMVERKWREIATVAAKLVEVKHLAFADVVGLVAPR